MRYETQHPKSRRAQHAGFRSSTQPTWLIPLGRNWPNTYRSAGASPEVAGLMIKATGTLCVARPSWSGLLGLEALATKTRAGSPGYANFGAAVLAAPWGHAPQWSIPGSKKGLFWCVDGEKDEGRRTTAPWQPGSGSGGALGGGCSRGANEQTNIPRSCDRSVSISADCPPNGSGRGSARA